MGVLTKAAVECKRGRGEGWRGIAPSTGIAGTRVQRGVVHAVSVGLGET